MCVWVLFLNVLKTLFVCLLLGFSPEYYKQFTQNVTGMMMMMMVIISIITIKMMIVIIIIIIIIIIITTVAAAVVVMINIIKQYLTSQKSICSILI